MSATLPPTALDRSSDIGELWKPADPVPRLPSLAPEAEPARERLTPAQSARRMRLQRLVAFVISGLFAFTALAAIIYAVKRNREAALVAAAAKPAPLAAAPASTAQLTLSATMPSGSDAPPALATSTAVAPPASRQSAVQASGQLGTPTRSHASVARPKPTQTRATRPRSRKLPCR